MVHWNYGEFKLEFVHTSELILYMWGFDGEIQTKQALNYIRCVCFMFVYSVLNLLTIHSAGQ
jgi:hypothetical protein